MQWLVSFQSVSFLCSGMIRTSLTVAKCLLIKPQMWQHFTHRDSYCMCIMQFFTWLGYCACAPCNLSPDLGTVHVQCLHVEAFLIFCSSLSSHSSQRIQWKWYADPATPTHCSTRIHSNYVSVENKTRFIHTWNLFILVPNFVCVCLCVCVWSV